MRTYTQSELETRLAYWQKRLGLEHWQIVIQLKRAKDMRIEDSQGCHESHHSKRMSIIHILDPIDMVDSPFAQDHEQTLIHELLHLHIDPIQMADTRDHQDLELERAIELISRAFVVETEVR